MIFKNILKSTIRYYDDKKEYYNSINYYNSLINKNIGTTNGLSLLQEKEIIEYFSGYNLSVRDTTFHELNFTTTGEFSPKYIPRYLFRNKLLTRFNQGHTWINRMRGWRDKNKYDLLKFGRFVPTEGRIIRGMVLGGDYRPISASKLCSYLENVSHEVVIKISDYNGGMGVNFLPVSELSEWIDVKIRESSKTGLSYLIQLPFKQHENILRLNASSVNTIRLTTLRLPGLDPLIRQVSPFIRIGRKNSRMDNVSQGNICVGVHDDGRLHRYAFDNAFNKYETHPDHGYSFGKITIDQFKESVALCIDMHYHLYEMDMIAWDVVINRDGTPLILEFNVEFLNSDNNQVCNGPFFGDDTDYILMKYLTSK
jgi:hypothetical protein